VDVLLTSSICNEAYIPLQVSHDSSTVILLIGVVFVTNLKYFNLSAHPFHAILFNFFRQFYKVLFIALLNVSLVV